MNHRGAAAVEAAIVVPVFMLLLAALVGLWRVSWVRVQVVEAAAASARAATLPHGAAEQAARSDLETVGVHCLDVRVDVDSGTSRVRCVVPLSDLVLPGVPGTITVEAAATEVSDDLRRDEP